MKIIKLTKHFCPLLQQKKALLLFMEVMLPLATHSTLTAPQMMKESSINYKKGILP